jgi:hypothetical protein
LLLTKRNQFSYAARPVASTTPCVRLLRHVARHVAWLVTLLVVNYFASPRLVVDYFAYAARPGASAHRAARHTARCRLLRAPQLRLAATLALLQPRRASRLLVSWQHWLYINYATRLGASARRATHHAAHRAAHHRLLHLRCASGCLGTSRASSCGSSSTTLPTPRVRVPRHVARLIMWLVIEYFAYARVQVPRHVVWLVVDNFAYTARPSASARRATHLWLVVNYFAYSVCPSAPACHAASRRLLRLRRVSGASARRMARRRLLRLRHACGCLGTSRGSSRGSSSTTSPTPRVRVPRHLTRLVVDYFAYTARPGASARRAAHHVARRRLLRLRRVFECLGTSRCLSSTTSLTPRIRVPRHVTRLVVDYFAYTARPGASARRGAQLWLVIDYFDCVMNNCGLKHLNACKLK